jgi:hypothetical protein
MYTPTVAPHSYRLFEEQEVVELSLIIANTSERPVFVDQTVVAAGVRLSVRSESIISIEVQWAPLAQVGDGSPSPAPLGASALLESGSSVAWMLHVRRTDGTPFTAGIHSVAYTINLAGALTSTTGEAARHPPALDAELRFDVQPPTSRRELALNFRLDADRAIRANDLIQAADAYSRAVAADPTDDSNHVGLAIVYVGLERYKEAIQVLQPMWPRVGGGSDMVPRALAQAYVGIGDAQSAVITLRSAGFTDARVAQEVTKLQGTVQRRRER